MLEIKSRHLTWVGPKIAKKNPKDSDHQMTMP